MSYSTGEALLLTRVQACTGFLSSNTSRGNWRILNEGKAAVYAILRPGPDQSDLEWISPNVYRLRWRCVIEVWQRYTVDGTTATDLYANVAAMIAILNYPRLGGALVDSTIVSIGALERRWMVEGGPQFLSQDIAVSWDEETKVTFSE
jgi:hypothetical protein